MVQTPRLLVSAAVTLVALQMQQTSASSLEYDPVTTCHSGKIGPMFPGYGGEYIEGDCTVTVKKDPNQPAGMRRLETGTDEDDSDIALLEDAFNFTMEMTLANLPTAGVFEPTPWPSSMWPAYKDSINAVWREGELSPAEKYALAFGDNVSSVMEWISWEYGVDKRTNGGICTSDSDCSPIRGSEAKCGIRTNHSSGYCVPTASGIGHAWSSAAILEDEARCSVTYNNVTFLPFDVKALMSYTYTTADVGAVFVGSRFNGNDTTTDAFGRHVNDQYRDMNPALFHVAAANLLGRLNTTFIVDVDAGQVVWNHPVQSFQVLETTIMSSSKAAQTFYGLEKYPWNSDAKSIAYVKTRLQWTDMTEDDGPKVSTGQMDKYTAGADYHYLLELSSNGTIIGGEWLYDSNDHHPDFLWTVSQKPGDEFFTGSGIGYADMKMLLQKSVACE